MKKFIFSLAIAVFMTATPKAINAQTTEGFVGELILEHTDSIQVLPGLYEFWTHSIKNPDVMAFMYSLNDDLYTMSIKTKGKKKVRLEGPPLDMVSADRLQSEYRTKRWKEVTKLQDEVDDLMKIPDKEKKKDRKKRLVELADAKKALAKKKTEVEADFKKLESMLKLRGRQGGYPVYNWQVDKTT